MPKREVMRALILLITLSALANAQLFGLFGGGNKPQGKTVTAEIDWRCPSVDYQEPGLHQFPRKEKINVSFYPTKNGQGFEFEPDIFNSNKRFGNWTRQSSTNANVCVEFFKENFQLWLAQNKDAVCEQEPKLCGQDNEIGNSFSKELEDGKYVKESRRPGNFPRFYAGHSFFNAAESELKAGLKSFCSGRPTRPEMISSKAFLQYAKNAAANPLIELKTSCLDKLDRFNKNLPKIPSECSVSGSFCAQVKDDVRDYQNHFANLRDGRVAAVQKTLEENENDRTYRLASNAQKAKISQNIANMRPGERVTCLLEQSFQVNGREGSMMFYDDAIQSAMPRILNSSKKCKKHFLKNYLLNKYLNKDPLKSEKCRQTDRCKNMVKAKQIFEENVQTLLADIYGEKAQKAACFSDENYRASNIELDDFLDNIERISKCSEVKKGETKVVDGIIGTVASRYALSKTGNKSYKATIALDIRDGLEATSVSKDEMFNRVKQCAETASTYFRSPSGETMQLEIIDADAAQKMPAGKRPPVNQIDIKDKDHRSSSGSYAEDIDCPTITHEVLHLMGLCDEYKENKSYLYVDSATGEIINESSEKGASDPGVAKMKRYQCRASSPIPSIMKSQDEVYDAFVGEQSVCQCQTEQCRQIAGSGDEKLEQLYFGNIWEGVEDSYLMCDFRTLETKQVKTIEELKKLPSQELVSQSENEVVFDHTIIRAPKSEEYIAEVALERYTCANPETQKLRDTLNEIRRRTQENSLTPPKHCPIGTKAISKKAISYEDGLKAKNGVEYENGVITITRRAPNAGKSLLHPAHFARIKHGACASKVKNYTTCAKYAYKDLPSECADKPKMCEDPEKWLLSAD